MNICFWSRFLVESQCGNLSLRIGEGRGRDIISQMPLLNSRDWNTMPVFRVVSFSDCFVFDPFSMILCSMSLNPVMGTGYYHDPSQQLFLAFLSL